MPAKPKATKRPSIAAKAKAVAAMFGEPEPRETLDFCYRRRMPAAACASLSTSSN